MITFQFKRGRIADLIALNPTPLEGEFIVDLDSGRFKVGDGVRAWSALPYAVPEVSLPAHAASHAALGSDPLSLTANQISNFATAALDAVAAKTLSSLPDVSAASPSTNDVLVYKSGLWTSSAPRTLVPAMWVSAPATRTSTGTTGQIAYDSNYIYVCVNTNTWSRAALSAW